MFIVGHILGEGQQNTEMGSEEVNQLMRGFGNMSHITAGTMNTCPGNVITLSWYGYFFQISDRFVHCLVNFVHKFHSSRNTNTPQSETYVHCTTMCFMKYPQRF